MRKEARPRPSYRRDFPRLASSPSKCFLGRTTWQCGQRPWRQDYRKIDRHAPKFLRHECDVGKHLSPPSHKQNNLGILPWIPRELRRPGLTLFPKGAEVARSLGVIRGFDSDPRLQTSLKSA